ncbi:MAG: DEAD/DEAH box helicase, partial [Kiritimatiellae bacterium]|nr:DEAD/DEAH box helicase [Kiritimatiellia bacterium]
GGGEGAPPRLSPDGFAGTLRDYQARGVAWMKFLTDNGFGALLADDMGLGKTVQVIAWMLANRADAKDSGPYLVVAPLTLLANWRHELARFAPALRVYSHQGDSRRLAHGFALAAGEADVVVTSYSLLVRDYRLLREVAWAGIVLDEAQTVKNPDTQAARAVRALGGRRRVALTGTPVENSAADIWSVEEFLNPTFLGDRRTFAERFVKPVAADSSCRAAAKLRRALEPFLLRRLKGDGDIAAEIGDKREIREYCTLSPGDRREYEAALEDYRAGERRQGDVFALITRLKLVCDGEGKMERLEELLESVFANGESALVFTQYAKVGAVIAERLEKRFGRRFPFLHGGLSARQREAAIAEFESGGATAFVLSLQAGGYGLNLVKATHVVHFDRWWNPAVESQATDRAHRIGQTRTVFVHSFITEGTLEEHVDELLARKSRVAGSLVGSGESFLRELGEAELMEVVGLR